jgi:hemoglobin-like flavoprotein
VFSFGEGHVVDEELFKSKRLIRHAEHYMNMVDRAINLLGPDIELLTDIMLELGQQHYKFGVEASFYPPMGVALLEVLQKFLGDSFTEEMKNSWLETYQALAYDMIRSKKV